MQTIQINVKINNKVYNKEISFSKTEWKIQAGAYFNYPVDIGGNLCFIKRFERRPPGWELVESLKGESHAHLPKIYFSGIIREHSTKYAYYLVTEYCKGETLSDILAKRNVSPCLLLPSHIMSSLKTIHDKNYWFADLCEKNIFWDTEKQRFILIDLDSCEPLTQRPSHIINEPGYIPGQEFAISTVLFFKEEMNKTEFKFNSVQGDVMNYFQMMFLSSKIGLYREQLQQLENLSYSKLKEKGLHQVFFKKIKDISNFKKEVNRLKDGGKNFSSIKKYCKLFILTNQESEDYFSNYVSSIRNLENKIESKVQENKAIKSVMQRLGKEKDILEKEMKLLNEEKDILEKEMRILMSENSKIKSDIKEYQSNVVMLNKRVNDLRKQLTQNKKTNK